MKSPFHAGRSLVADMASTFFFMGLLALTHDVMLAVAMGMALGVAQIAWQRLRSKPIDAMQWLSLFLVISSGTATLILHDPRFAMAKASVIYVIVGVVMSRPGWMNRYLPEVAHEVMPDLVFAFGLIWAGLMFASAGLNLVLALMLKPMAWAAFMSAWALGSKLTLFGIQYTTMRVVGRMRVRRGLVAAAA